MSKFNSDLFGVGGGRRRNAGLTGWLRTRRLRYIEHRVHQQLAADIREQLRRDLGL